MHRGAASSSPVRAQGGEQREEHHCRNSSEWKRLYRQYQSQEHTGVPPSKQPPTDSEQQSPTNCRHNIQQGINGTQPTAAAAAVKKGRIVCSAAAAAQPGPSHWHEWEEDRESHDPKPLPKLGKGLPRSPLLPTTIPRRIFFSHTYTRHTV